MERILVPTDFSTPAEHATELATRLAILHGASLHLVHSVDVPATWQEGRFSNAKLASRSPREQEALFPEARAKVGEARMKLEQLTMALAKRKVKATYEVAPNAAWEDVMRSAKRQKADLVVMGTRGTGALKEAFIGSNTQRVVRLSAAPVLTLHEAPPTRIANVAVLADPIEKGIDKYLHQLLLPLNGPRVRFHLLHVNTPGRFQDTDSSLEQLRTLSKRLDPKVTINVADHFSVAEGAIAFARREGMDAIALTTHGRSGLQGLLNASVAESVVNHAPVPVLTLRIG